VCGHTRGPVIYSKFHPNPFRGFGAPGGQNLAFPITLASRFYNSLYYRTSRDVSLCSTVTQHFSCSVNRMLIAGKWIYFLSHGISSGSAANCVNRLAVNFRLLDQNMDIVDKHLSCVTVRLAVVVPPPADSFGAMMIVWRIRGKIVRIVLCCIVYDICEQ